jgi:hypothetical protein
MGQNNSRPQGQFMEAAPSCTDDLMCQHIDERRSIPGKDPVVLCKSAKCVMGTCSCGKDCKRDPYEGSCCKDVETRITKTPHGDEVTTFCITGKDKYLDDYERKHNPTHAPFPKKVCNIKDQSYNGMIISGKQICNWYENQ